MNEEDMFMQELMNDPEYIAWCDERDQEANEHMQNLSDEDLEGMFMPQAKYMVFVYGSLKRGFGNHVLLQDSKFLGITETVNRVYRMHSLGAFPAVVDAGDDAFAIVGELYEVDMVTLKRLDMLEGNGSMYTRRLTSVYNGSDVTEAWTYFMPDSHTLIDREIRYPTNRFVYTDNKLNTQEWCQE